MSYWKELWNLYKRTLKLGVNTKLPNALGVREIQDDFGVDHEDLLKAAHQHIIIDYLLNICYVLALFSALGLTEQDRLISLKQLTF